MQDIFQPRHNCWRVARADSVAVIVDYGNYYRNLRESILKAKKSIFVLGWDIDSRIELLRGDDGAGEEAVTFFDLIVKVATENPDLKVYLNKWDYSLFFMQQRELFWMRKWTSAKLPNVYCCLDDVLPLGACHHQKVVVIDDEIAYWGGMDVALGRWDFRHHHVRNLYRADPELMELGEKKNFGPYHDIQAVLSGAAARVMAELVRERWRLACPSVEPVPISKVQTVDPPNVWPDSDPPDFSDIDVAIARTLPAMDAVEQTEEVIHILIDQITMAENFIYIENQFLTSPDIADALNRQLRMKPHLRVLMVSCWQPQGIMERKVMWGGRLRFRHRLEKEGVAHRTAMAHPVCCENGKKAHVRIHSKLMIVDDKFLHIGSANLNNRSMGMDTECDLTLKASTPAHREKIAAVRNDLIREHTGFSVERIEGIIREGKSPVAFLDEKSASRQHLEAIDDSAYAKERGVDWLIPLGDPRRPFLIGLLRFSDKIRFRGWKGRRMAVAATIGIVLLLAALSLLWSVSGLEEFVKPEIVAEWVDKIDASPFEFLWIIGAYILGGLIFFPVTVLSAAIILAFGGLKGFVYTIVGGLASGALGYAIGYLLGRERLQRLFPSTKKTIKKLRAGGVIGVTAVRMMPIAPFSLVNLLMGVIHIPFYAYLTGTFLGLLPGKVMLALFGTSLKSTFTNPSPTTVIQTALLLVLWLGIIFLCHHFASKWQTRRKSGQGKEYETGLEKAAIADSKRSA